MAGSMNKAILVGRLGQDPSNKFTATGRQVSQFSLATDESYQDKNGDKVDKAEWHRIVCWGKLADLVTRYIKKGSLVLVEGKLQTRKWQDKQGNDRWTTEVVARNVQFLDSKGSGGNAQPEAGGMPDSSSADYPDDAPF